MEERRTALNDVQDLPTVCIKKFQLLARGASHHCNLQSHDEQRQILESLCMSGHQIYPPPLVTVKQNDMSRGPKHQ